MSGSSPLQVDGRSLTPQDVWDVAVHNRPVALDSDALDRMHAARSVVESILDRGDTVYGVNTGFGHLAHVRVEAEDLTRLQGNLVRSHAAGVGEPFDIAATRTIMLLRANVLAVGHSGAQPELAERLIELLNRQIHPWIPSQGSVGASGDLAPLAHLALVLLGEGWVHGADGERIPTAERLSGEGLQPLTLAAKDGLSLINGTQAMTGLGSLVLVGAERLAKVADVAGSMTVEAKLASHRPFDPRLHELRPHPGQLEVAQNLRTLLQGGTINSSHANCEKVQDAYSLRCMPQVHGASRGAFAHVREILEREINSVTDNPTLFPDQGDIISGGNFHGQPVAMALDYLAMGISELGAISERRIEQLVNPRLSALPAFLVEDAGLNSGFMIAQVTAAARASENKGLCHPASVDSIPTSANQEDHVSMGPIAARQALKVLKNTEQILAIELLVASQAIDFQAPLVPADGPRAAFQLVREHVEHMSEDRVLYEDIRALAALVRSGSLMEAVETLVGELE